MTAESKDADIAASVGIAIGDTIGGRYEIVRLLGSGGMGAVFEARHKAIDKLVAVKVLRRDVARDPQLSPRFLQEARAANEVRHKNIVQILDFGVDGERHYMVLEYLHGETLASLIERERWLQPGRIIQILEPILRALAFAHQRDIVHRDIKPDNIFLSVEEGEDHPTPKILDFGIAKRKMADNARLTKTETGLGTPAYMSPEQITAARDVTSAADQFAIGVILYETLTARRPHDAETYEQMIIAKVTQPPVPIRVRHPELDEGLCAVVMRAISRAPEDRFESALALRDALLPYREQTDSPIPPALDPFGTPARASHAPTVRRSGARDAATVASGRVPAATGATKTQTPEAWTTGRHTGARAEPTATSRRAPALITLAAIVIAAGAYAALRGPFGTHAASHVLDTHAAPVATPPPAETPTPPAAVATPTAMLRIHVDPPETAIELDGDVVAHGVAEIGRPRDGRSHRLRLSAPGRTTIDDVWVADGDMRLDRALDAMTPPPSQPSTASPPAGTAHTHHEGSHTAPASNSGSHRGIDRDNPF